MAAGDGWTPLSRDAYAPIEDYGLVGDCSGAALVGLDGSVGFLCVPRFDSPPLFCGMLDHERGGTFALAPDGVVSARRFYRDDSAVLVTESRTPTGLVQVTDAFVLRPGARLRHDEPAAGGAMVRHAVVVHGTADLRVTVRPFGESKATREAGGWRLTCAEQSVSALVASAPALDSLDTTVTLREGEELCLTLDWGLADRPVTPARAREAVERTVRAWREWAGHIVDDLPRPAMVRRSAITLKLLDYAQNGAVVAAPTSSLPEYIGGSRNWDYRYSWIRDAAYVVFALRRIGLPEEAGGFLQWALHTAAWEDRPRVLYAVDGTLPGPETVDGTLRGYRGSAPVRWGNAAVEQDQHDVYGEILDCAFQWAATGGRIGPDLWHRLAALADRSRTAWHDPDHGIWEVRTPGRPYTYSAAMCQVALDRAARLARRLGLPGDPDGWSHDARKLTDHILTDAWDDTAGALTEHLGPGGGLDAGLLALPLRRVVPVDHPRMVATRHAIARRLDAGDGLLHRYLPEESPDGIGQPEGAFLLCSFWMVDNLVGHGRTDAGLDLFDRLCRRANPLGLLPEQVDPTSGAFLGNFPQALSHVGLVSSAVALARAERGLRPELSTEAWFR
ncbi:glycoside hydrolase family 15 protein [Streptomyces sp. TRM64462]|uniref:glycoside hydrolase family 15 protein n=1 Tax=Streptomyces sp. TRM64462 TaxID=2741726 RepID=UPI00158689F1|nr:glycoside hydrolase family 15 protein [Streptomyces sp. TRM64462]